MVEGLKPPVKWMRSYFEHGDVLFYFFYFEFDEDGWVLRQVELEGSARVPITAASLAERPDPRTDGLGAVREYDARYGGIGDQPLPTGDFAGPPHEDISANEFEEVWRGARASLEERA